ncbi:MAG: tetratricopeptide repeat protein [Butyribacter sp.]|nr:tetratricopeptide repeat protein [Butyribacter sp.]
MAKRVKFPLEMRDGVQVRNIDELREYFDIEKALGYLVDGKLSTWLEDRYYINEADIIKGIDPYAADAKDILCSALGVELEVGSTIDMEEIERRKERLARLKQYSDDEMLWEKIDQVAFGQEDLENILEKGCHEIYLCGEDIKIPLAIHNVKYIGVKKFNVILDGEGGTQYCREHGVLIENLKYESSGLEEGEEKYMNYELQDAFELLLPEAERGEGRAMFLLCLLYSDGGCGLEISDEKAKNWCLKGEKAGDPLSILYRAIRYCKDKDRAKEFCQQIKPQVKKMAETGDVLAQYVLGISYRDETDEPVNQKKVVEYLRKASDVGYWKAEYDLGIQYYWGEGVEENELTAMEYYKKSAAVGYAPALHDLGMMYEQDKYEDINKANECFQKESAQYSQSMKTKWKNELVQKIKNVTQINCSSKLFYAENATGCSGYNFGLNGSYSSEGACRSAGESKINSCIQWLQDSWMMSNSYSDERYHRLADICENYSKRIEKIYELFVEYYIKICGKSIETMESIPEYEIVDNTPGVSDVIQDVVREGNYSYYSSYEAVSSINCADMGLDDSYIFRQAKWKIMGWSDSSLSRQENEKCRDFSEALYQRIKCEILQPIQEFVEKYL